MSVNSLPLPSPSSNLGSLVNASSSPQRVLLAPTPLSNLIVNWNSPPAPSSELASQVDFVMRSVRASDSVASIAENESRAIQGSDSVEDEIESSDDSSGDPHLDATSSRAIAIRKAILAWSVSLSGAASMSVILSILLVTLANIVSAFLSLRFTSPLLILAIAWMLFMSLSMILIVPRGLRCFGLHMRRVAIPEFLQKRTRMDSIADHLRQLRTALVVAAAMPVVIMMLHSAVSRITRFELSTFSSFPMIAISLMFLAIGAGVWFVTLPLYCQSHQRRLRNSLRFYHRGVALRSFISAWDNPSRKIYLSCRLSARLAKVHRISMFAVLCSFSAAASCAALVQSEFFLGEIMCVLSLVAIISLWPTSHRLVRWSSKVLDPLCGESEEYIIT